MSLDLISVFHRTAIIRELQQFKLFVFSSTQWWWAKCVPPINGALNRHQMWVAVSKVFGNNWWNIKVFCRFYNWIYYEGYIHFENIVLQQVIRFCLVFYIDVNLYIFILINCAIQSLLLWYRKNTKFNLIKNKVDLARDMSKY